MMSSKKIALVLAATMAAGIAGACARDGAGRIASAPGTAPDIVAGGRVRGHLSRRIQLLGPGGTVRAESTATESFDAAVRDGTPGQTGPLVAVSSGAALRLAPLTYTDTAGHAHAVAFERGEPGEPPRAIQATLDGRPFARVELTWRRAGHGFMLAHRASTFLGPDGRAVAREDVTADVDEVAGATVAARALGGLVRLASCSVLPTRLEATAMMDAGCFSQILYYAGASLAVAIGVFAIAAEPWNLKLWAAEIAAIGAWDAALDALLTCMMA